MTTTKQVTIIPQPGGFPPPLNSGYGLVPVSKDMAAVFVPTMGLGTRLPGRADCYIADIAVDGKAVSQLVLIAKHDGTNIIGADWDGHMENLALWLKDNLLTDLYSFEEQNALAKEFFDICTLGLFQQSLLPKS
jgi:hypothetical protein